MLNKVTKAGNTKSQINNMSVVKILWVDDEIDSLTSQVMFLENKGYEVHTKTNGFDAIEVCKEYRPDIVLMDIKKFLHQKLFLLSQKYQYL